MKRQMNRVLSVFLALMMAVSLLPVSAFAVDGAEVHDHEHEDVAAEASALLQEVKDAVDGLLAAYDLEVGMTEAQLEDVALNGDYTGDPLEDQQALEEQAEGLTEAELEELQEYEALETWAQFCEVYEDAYSIALLTTVTVLDGQLSIADSANSNTVSNGTVTIKASGSLFSKKTNNITITNDTENKAQLSFDYSVSSANSFKIAGATAATSGNYTVTLDAGGTLAITLVSNSGFSNTTATLTMSNFSLITASDSSNVTFLYDSSYGSITVDGNSVLSGAVVEGITLDTGVALTATASNGASFLGWVNTADGSILSSTGSYTLKPASDMTVKAVFAKNGDTPWFMVGSATQKSQSSGLLGLSKLYYYQVPAGTHLFDNLNDAGAAAANSATSKAVVLMNSGTLGAGNYTIPAGVTLLIPFDSSNTMYTTQVVPEDIANYSTPEAYRTLTMGDGANLTINGAVSVSAKQCWAAGSKQHGG